MIDLFSWDRIEIKSTWKTYKNMDDVSIECYLKRGSVQEVYTLQDRLKGNVLKIITWDTAALFQSQFQNESIGFSEFYYNVLSALETAWVPLPENYDAIELLHSKHWEKQELLGFIQKYYPWCKEIGWGKLPYFWQSESGFLNIEEQSREPQLNEFFKTKDGKKLFLDWDKYLLHVLSGKQENESHEEFYQRIANTKV